MRASSMTDAESPGIWRAAVLGFGPSALPKATTGIPALIAFLAQFISGGPATALSANASYLPEAMASLQLAISLGTLLLESKTSTLTAPSALATALTLLMIACSTGFDWIATKRAIVTGFLAAGLPVAVPTLITSTPVRIAATASVAPTALALDDDALRLIPSSFSCGPLRRDRPPTPLGDSAYTRCGCDYPESP